MNHYLYIIFAWLSLLTVILLLAIFPISKLSEIIQNKKLIKFKHFLKKWHKLLAVILISIMIIHGKTAMKRPSIEAIMLLVLMIIFLISYLLKKRFFNTWLYLHRILSVLFMIMLIIHLLKAYL